MQFAGGEIASFTLPFHEYNDKINDQSEKSSNKFHKDIRSAIENCGKTRYRIAKDTGSDAAVMCRFVQGRTGPAKDAFDKLLPYRVWRIVPAKPTTKKGRK